MQWSNFTILPLFSPLNFFFFFFISLTTSFYLFLLLLLFFQLYSTTGWAVLLFLSRSGAAPPHAHYLRLFAHAFTPIFLILNKQLSHENHLLWSLLRFLCGSSERASVAVFVANGFDFDSIWFISMCIFLVLYWSTLFSPFLFKFLFGPFDG